MLSWIVDNQYICSFTFILLALWIRNKHQFYSNHISGVMVNVFALSAVGLWFKPRSGQTNDYKIDICCIKEKEQRRARNQENVPE